MLVLLLMIMISISVFEHNDDDGITSTDHLNDDDGIESTDNVNDDDNDIDENDDNGIDINRSIISIIFIKSPTQHPGECSGHF